MRVEGFKPVEWQSKVALEQCLVSPRDEDRELEVGRAMSRLCGAALGAEEERGVVP